MTTSRFVRWSGLDAMVAGLVTAAGIFPFLSEDPDPVFELLGALVRTVLIGIALIGIYLFQKDEAGILGLIGTLAALVGNLLFLSDVSFFLSGSLYSLGLILLAIGSLRALKFPRWVPILWVLTIVLGFPGFFIESLEVAAFVAGAVVLGLAFIGAGYTMWSQTSAQPIDPSSARISNTPNINDE